MDRFTYKYYYQANGQLMATYNSELYNGTERTTTLEEQYIYGSNRIGALKANKGVYFNGTHQPAMIDIQSNKIGEKRYELTNHLGNVLATITDRKIYNSTDGYYEPVITMKADYYAFGMLMPNRFEGVDEARHLFNGMEHDMEVSGSGNSYTTQFRQYDSRLGRWKSLDPLMSMFPNMSSYVGFANNPIFFTDPYGLAPTNGDGDPPKEGATRQHNGRSEVYAGGSWGYDTTGGEEHTVVGEYKNEWIRSTKDRIQNNENFEISNGGLYGGNVYELGTVKNFTLTSTFYFIY